MIPILFLLLAVPAIGAIASLLIGNRHANSFGAAIAVINLVIGLIALHYFVSGVQLGESYFYIPLLNIDFGLSMTGASLFLVLLTVIVFAAAAISNIYFMKEKTGGYNALFLFVEATALGLFMSANLFFFYIFWDLSIVALFFILFRFGGYDRRYAAVKFIIYSIVSSSLLLIAILMLYVYTPGHSFSISYISTVASSIPRNAQLGILALLMLAFMIKVPVFPFHSWIPDAYSEAPPSGAMLLSGILSKFGAYGILLMFALLPVAREYSAYIAAFFIFSVLYAAFVALAQKELKRMLAYLSMAEMGIIVFGIATLNALGTEGALFGMLSHALIISILFALVFIIERIFGTTTIANIRGIANSNRIITYAFLFGVLAAIGLPLTTGFITEFLIFLGGVKSFGLIGILPLAGVFINGAYLFWVFERSFFSTSNEMRTITGVGRSAYAAVAIMIAFVLVFGILPYFLLNAVGGLV